MLFTHLMGKILYVSESFLWGSLHKTLGALHSMGTEVQILIATIFQLHRSWLDILHHKEKNVCDECGEKFANYEDLINHARHIHHHPIVKCNECGREFIHEKDRLHHVIEERKKKVENKMLMFRGKAPTSFVRVAPDYKNLVIATFG